MHYSDDEGLTGPDRIPWLKGTDSSNAGLDREALEILRHIHRTLSAIEEQMAQVRRSTARTTHLLKWCILGVSVVVIAQVIQFVLMIVDAH